MYGAVWKMAVPDIEWRFGSVKWLMKKQGQRKRHNWTLKIADIKLVDSGEYLYNDYFLASVDGKYGLYSKSCKKKTDIQGTDVDYFTSEGLCFVSFVRDEYCQINLKFTN